MQVLCFTLSGQYQSFESGIIYAQYNVLLYIVVIIVCLFTSPQILQIQML